MNSEPRLNFFTRKVSAEELNHRKSIQQIGSEIKEVRKTIRDKMREFKKRRQKQDANGLQIGEKPVTAERIESILQPYRQQLKKLEADYQALVHQSGQVQKASTKQTDIFN